MCQLLTEVIKYRPTQFCQRSEPVSIFGLNVLCPAGRAACSWGTGTHQGEGSSVNGWPLFRKLHSITSALWDYQGQTHVNRSPRCALCVLHHLYLPFSHSTLYCGASVPEKKRISLAYKKSCLMTWPWKEGVLALALAGVSSHCSSSREFLGWGSVDRAWGPPCCQNWPLTPKFLACYLEPAGTCPSAFRLCCSAHLSSPSSAPCQQVPFPPAPLLRPHSIPSHSRSLPSATAALFAPTFLFLLSVLCWLPIRPLTRP